MSDTELTREESEAVAIGDYKYGFHDEVTSVFATRRGLDEDVVREISAHKSEPEWMLDFRLKSHKHFLSRPMPQWGADLSTIDFDNIYYYLKPVEEQAKSWDDLPPGMRETWDKLGIPEAEKKYLAGFYKGDPTAEYLTFFRAGVDGVFTDFAGTGRAVADRVCSAHGLLVLQGLPLRVPAPKPRARRWFPCWS